MLTNEDVSLALFGLGLYLLFNKETRRQGYIISSVSLAYFIAANLLLMPDLRTDGRLEMDYYGNLIPASEDANFVSKLKFIVSDLQVNAGSAFAIDYIRIDHP